MANPNTAMIFISGNKDNLNFEVRLHGACIACNMPNAGRRTLPQLYDAGVFIGETIRARRATKYVLLNGKRYDEGGLENARKLQEKELEKIIEGIGYIDGITEA